MKAGEKAEGLRRQGGVAAALAASRGPIGALSPDLLVVRARTLWAMEHTEAAVEPAAEAVRRAPALPAARAMRGLTRLDAGDLGAAWDEAEYAHKRAPEEPLTYVLPFERSRRLLDSAVAAQPWHVGALGSDGWSARPRPLDRQT
ncbi:hypothetical protein ACWD5F_38575 [Streptomyces sp. NPDC002499]